MKIGLIGLSSTGKTTLFNLLTNSIDHSSIPTTKRMEPHLGVARIPDKRIDFLATKYKPRKTIYATIDVTDIRGITPEGNTKKEAGPDNFLESVRQTDALVHVVRAFHNDDVIHMEGTIDPLRDIDSVNMELLFADLAVIENRIHKIETSKKMTKEMAEELEVLKKCRGCLESEKLIHSLELTDDEKQYIKTFQFLTERPLVLLVNLDEDQFRSSKYENREKLIKYAAERDIPMFEISARTEFEISRLDAEDKMLFMEDLGIKDTGISRLANLMYNYLGLISFLTVGEDEVRAWTVRKGITAKAAGGRVHSDIERGFIRAEVFKYSDFERLKTVHALKEKGLFRLEGKDYIIEDGDIINFRFNV